METEPAGGLYAFEFTTGQSRPGWYVLLSALASMVSRTPENIGVLSSRHPSLLERAPPVLRLRGSELPKAIWKPLLDAYATVLAGLQAGGERKRKKKRPPQNLTLYPLSVAMRIMHHYAADIEPELIQAAQEV